MILLFQIMILQTGTCYHPGNYSIFVYNKPTILITDKIFNVCFCTDIFMLVIYFGIPWKICSLLINPPTCESVRIGFRRYRRDLI